MKKPGMKIRAGAPARRIRQFLSHAGAHGLMSACRMAGRFLDTRARSLVGVRAGMPWREFESRFLARRDAYKGVFVQNVVVQWNIPLFQRPQQMALALGRLGYLVIYKTPYPVLDGVAVEGVHNIAPNVYLTGNESFDFIDGAVHSVYSTAFNHPLDWIERRDSSFRAIYEYVDHIDPKISGSKDNVRNLIVHKRHAFAEGRYDFVIATARRLETEAVEAIGRDKVIFIPNGVDAWHYGNAPHGRVNLPERLLEFRSRYANVIGYFGAIAPWLWYEELAKLVDGRPDLGFVFIGPDYFDCAGRLPRTDNVLRLGAVDYGILPAYTNQFDVCFIPFEPGEIARTTSPLKLFESFALEKPVVVTSEMLECTAFREVLSGDDADSLSAAIDRAIGLKADRAFKDRLARLADENSWDNRARLLEGVFPSSR